MASEAARHKELDLIQKVIERMAKNSFQVKAWLIGVLAAIIAFEKDAIFAGGGEDPALAIILNLFLFLPICCFWTLDAFFLGTEKLYREVYKWVIKHRENTDNYLYDLNTFERTVNGQTENLIKEDQKMFAVMHSETLIWFYIVPLVFVVGLLAFNISRVMAS